MKPVSQSSKKRKSFGNLAVDNLTRHRYKMGTGQKPRPIANPGGRSGMRKGAGG